MLLCQNKIYSQNIKMKAQEAEQELTCEADLTRFTILMSMKGLRCVVRAMFDIGVTSWAQDFTSAFRRIASLEWRLVFIVER